MRGRRVRAVSRVAAAAVLLLSIATSITYDRPPDPVDGLVVAEGNPLHGPAVEADADLLAALDDADLALELDALAGDDLLGLFEPPDPLADPTPLDVAPPGQGSL